MVSQRGADFKPRILLATEDPGTRVRTPEVPRSLPPVTVKNPQFWDTVIAGMIHVVEGGTAHRIGIGAGYRIAGKTGTAQVFTVGQNERYNASRLARHLLDHALFVAFAPADDPAHRGGGDRRARRRWQQNRRADGAQGHGRLSARQYDQPAADGRGTRRETPSGMDRSNEGKFLRLIHLDLTLLLGLLVISGTGLVVLYSAGQRDLDLVTGQAMQLGLGFAIMLAWRRSRRTTSASGRHGFI